MPSQRNILYIIQRWQIVHLKGFVSLLDYKMGVKWIRKNHLTLKSFLFLSTNFTIILYKITTKMRPLVFRSIFLLLIWNWFSTKYGNNIDSIMLSSVIVQRYRNITVKFSHWEWEQYGSIARIVVTLLLYEFKFNIQMFLTSNDRRWIRRYEKCVCNGCDKVKVKILRTKSWTNEKGKCIDWERENEKERER